MIRLTSNLAMPGKLSPSDRKTTASSSRELLEKARAGDERALNSLWRRQGGVLRKWARGRLPRWARSLTETADVVQDVLLQTFSRLDRIDHRGKGALQAYLRQAVLNRIRDEMRRVARRPLSGPEEAAASVPSSGASPLDDALDAEMEQRYKQALSVLTEEEQLLVVGRLELDYTYEQLALVSNRPTAEAARLAVRRAILKAGKAMGSD
jgi:RNA polymerase sigma-70 factor (ECF subfamily)